MFIDFMKKISFVLVFVFAKMIVQVNGLVCTMYMKWNMPATPRGEVHFLEL